LTLNRLGFDAPAGSCPAKSCYLRYPLIYYQMPKALYFEIPLEPHHQYSGNRTGRQIRFLAEVSLSAAKNAARSPADKESVDEAARLLAVNLTSEAMTGQSHQPGEDKMRISIQSILGMSNDLTDRRPDAEKDGARVWLLGANVD
jgi:hypothetical protein